MNKQELIERIKKLPFSYIWDEPYLNKEVVLEAVEQLDEPQKVVVPQFVADWYEENKDDFEANLYRYAYNIPLVFDSAKINEFERWFLTAGTKPFQTLVNMHQFGYEVEKEKRYLVKFKGLGHEFRVLKYNIFYNDWFTGSDREDSSFKLRHTRKELEEAGFGWVFDCEGIEIEEVEE